MSSLNTALLDESKRDGSSILPALQKLLQLAYSDDTDKQLEVTITFLCGILCRSFTPPINRGMLSSYRRAGTSLEHLAMVLRQVPHQAAAPHGRFLGECTSGMTL